MPSILSPFKPDDGPYQSIGSSIRSLGQSIWGDEAKNEGLRQNALKLQRENSAHEAGADALRQGNAVETLAQGYRGGMGAGDATGYIRGYYGNTKGADSPEFEGAAAGAGEPWHNTPRGSREVLQNQRAMEQDRTDASRYTPYYNEDPRTGAKTPGGAFNTRSGQFQGPQGRPLQSGAQPTGFQNMGMYEDDNGQPINIPPAHMSHINDIDENGAPLISDEGKSRLAELYKRDPGYAGRLMAVIAGHAPVPSGARASKANAAFLNDLYAINPGVDAGVYGMRNKTYQDLATSGKTGQMSQALEQFTHHMTEEAIPRYSDLGNVDTIHPFSDSHLPGRVGNFVAAPLTGAANTARNTYNSASGIPGVGAASVVQEGVANELAKLMRTTGMSEAEIERNLHNLPLSSSPADFKSRVAAALGLVEGAFHSRENNINRVLGPDPARSPLMSPQTRAALEAVKTWTQGGQMPPMARQSKMPGQVPQGAPQPMVPPQGALPQGAFNDRFNGAPAPVRVGTPQESHALPPGTHYITPDGQEYVR